MIANYLVDNGLYHYTFLRIIALSDITRNGLYADPTRPQYLIQLTLHLKNCGLLDREDILTALNSNPIYFEELTNQLITLHNQGLLKPKLDQEDIDKLLPLKVHLNSKDHTEDQDEMSLPKPGGRIG